MISHITSLSMCDMSFCVTLEFSNACYDLYIMLESATTSIKLMFGDSFLTSIYCLSPSLKNALSPKIWKLCNDLWNFLVTWVEADSRKYMSGEDKRDSFKLDFKLGVYGSKSFWSHWFHSQIGGKRSKAMFVTA